MTGNSGSAMRGVGCNEGVWVTVLKRTLRRCFSGEVVSLLDRGLVTITITYRNAVFSVIMHLRTCTYEISHPLDTSGCVGFPSNLY